MKRHNASASRVCGRCSEAVRSWVALLATIIGGLLALMQYVDNSSAARAKETLNFVERLQTERAQEAKNNLMLFWEDVHADLDKKREDSGNEAANKYLIVLIEKRRIATHIDYIIDLYEKMHACVTAKLCDLGIATQFVGKEAFDLYGGLGPYLEYLRKEDHSYADGLMLFAREYGKKMLR